MDAIQRIECKNKAAFVMSFVITDGKFTSPSSGDYPVLQSCTIDLAPTKLPEGNVVWAVVSAYWGSTKAAAEKFTFAMNGKIAVYEVEGTLFGYSINFKGIEDDPGSRPPGFPIFIPIKQEEFLNWAHTIDVPGVWTCAPRSADDVVAACNWAAQNGYTVRPRGIMHNWSPLSVTPGLPDYNKLLLIDTTVSLNDISFIPPHGSVGPSVKVGTGATMAALMQFLETQQGGNGVAPGYSFPHIPAPDNLTVGGVMAINAHGTAVPTPPNDNFTTTYGSMSNRILSLTAVVTDPQGTDPTKAYQLKIFERGDKETTAFMTQLGRALITEVTIQVIDNYNLRCLSITNIDSATLFKEPAGGPPPPNSCGDFLNQSGRIEVIWFPFTTYPWLKVWTVDAAKPATSRQVDGPNNYTFSDNLPDFVTSLIDIILNSDPSLTVKFGQMMLDMTNSGLDGLVLGYPVLPQCRDIWGASKNTLFYVKDTTLRITANGYAVLMNKANVQQAIADFTTQFETMLTAYQGQNKFPINSPLEIRVTGLDSGDGMPSVTGGPAGRPVISSLATDAETIKNNWDVAVWFDVLTIPGTKYAMDFYTELEEWFTQHFTAPATKVVPEWSKGWAYTTNGAWTNDAFIDGIKQDFTTNRAADDNWAWEQAILAKYDAYNIYQSQLTQTLFS
ncbi:FAD binding domain-containing protein [Mucilaginibacter mallensis]|uniref:FAD binding domain-containing protein n=1 Tax=Mucilaginibacter mallensis TaxID=652787 RepID=A0A1H1WQZ2_MUCMA|nr:cholesterol oxidase substrate-binding domain-containing protein [Mucilaginibacter mallensis]SDS99442.1 FAD binding domain-containing protein [Mucilaginibacter mallensis]